MKKRTTFALLVLFALCVHLPAAGQDDSPATTVTVPAAPAETGPEQLKAQKAQLRKERTALREQLAAARSRLAKGVDVADLRKAYEDAEALYEAAKKDNPRIVEARKPYEQAKDAYDTARKALPENEAAKKADDAYDTARHALPEYEARNAAAKALSKIPKDDSAYAAAKKANDDAKAAYEAKKDALPEYTASKEAEKACAAATRALAEYTAYKDAEKTYLATTKEVLATPRKVRDDAEKALDAKVDELVKADPDAAKIAEQLKDVEARYAEVKKKIRDLEK